MNTRNNNEKENLIFLLFFAVNFLFCNFFYNNNMIHIQKISVSKYTFLWDHKIIFKKENDYYECYFVDENHYLLINNFFY